IIYSAQRAALRGEIKIEGCTPLEAAIMIHLRKHERNHSAVSEAGLVREISGFSFIAQDNVAKALEALISAKRVARNPIRLINDNGVLADRATDVLLHDFTASPSRTDTTSQSTAVPQDMGTPIDGKSRLTTSEQVLELRRRGITRSSVVMRKLGIRKSEFYSAKAELESLGPTRMHDDIED
ncbi:MAG: hypothetical protein ACHQX1_01930, partial [Candidatus Micrarchaeales archaeon]